jgi:hypothetical protein
MLPLNNLIFVLFLLLGITSFDEERKSVIRPVQTFLVRMDKRLRLGVVRLGIVSEFTSGDKTPVIPD